MAAGSSGAECNTAYNCLDRHVERGRGGQKALIYEAPSPTRRAAITYAELRDEVATLAGVLRDLGVDKGDRVILYMPMIPEAVIAHARLRPHRRRSIPWCSAASPRTSSPPASTTPSP